MTGRVNPDWPKYRLICGEFDRLLAPRVPIERLIDGDWRSDNP